MNITYYVLSESELELLDNEDGHFEDILNEKILLFHEYSELPFWKHNIEFGQGVKAWNPMLELLLKIDLTQNKSFKKELLKIINRNSSYILLPKEAVSNIWTVIKQISVEQLENSFDDKKIKDSIKESAGYRMSLIDHKELIIIEFMEFFKAFYEANRRNEKLMILIN